MSGEIRIAGPFVDGRPFKDGRATVARKVNNKVLWGVIDRDGKVIVPFISDEAIEFHDGFAAVKRRQSIRIHSSVAAVRPNCE